MNIEIIVCSDAGGGRITLMHHIANLLKQDGFNVKVHEDETSDDWTKQADRLKEMRSNTEIDVYGYQRMRDKKRISGPMGVKGVSADILVLKAI